MNTWKVVEKDNQLAVHCLTWSYERCLLWIEKYGDSGIFTDKTLNKNSFQAVKVTK